MREQIYKNDFSKVKKTAKILKQENFEERTKKIRQRSCAAKAFYSCPAIISRRPESQNTSKEPQLNPEEESRIIQATSHVTLERSSKNYKPSEE